MAHTLIKGFCCCCTNQIDLSACEIPLKTESHQHTQWVRITGTERTSAHSHAVFPANLTEIDGKLAMLSQEINIICTTVYAQTALKPKVESLCIKGGEQKASMR
jgi:hypothetical protein